MTKFYLFGDPERPEASGGTAYFRSGELELERKLKPGYGPASLSENLFHIKGLYGNTFHFNRTRPTSHVRRVSEADAVAIIDQQTEVDRLQAQLTEAQIKLRQVKKDVYDRSPVVYTAELFQMLLKQEGGATIREVKAAAKKLGAEVVDDGDTLEVYAPEGKQFVFLGGPSIITVYGGGTVEKSQACKEALQGMSKGLEDEA